MRDSINSCFANCAGQTISPNMSPVTLVIIVTMQDVVVIMFTLQDVVL